MTNVRAPGCPNAPATMPSTGSNSMTSATAASLLCRSRFGLRQQVFEPARVVALDHHRTERVKVELSDRCRRDVYPLEEIEMHARVVRDRGLDRVGVTHDDDSLVRMGGDDFFDRAD